MKYYYKPLPTKWQMCIMIKNCWLTCEVRNGKKSIKKVHRSELDCTCSFISRLFRKPNKTPFMIIMKDLSLFMARSQRPIDATCNTSCLHILALDLASLIPYLFFIMHMRAFTNEWHCRHIWIAFKYTDDELNTV